MYMRNSTYTIINRIVKDPLSVQLGRNRPVLQMRKKCN